MAFTDQASNRAALERPCCLLHGWKSQRSAIVLFGFMPFIAPFVLFMPGRLVLLGGMLL